MPSELLTAISAIKLSVIKKKKEKETQNVTRICVFPFPFQMKIQIVWLLSLVSVKVFACIKMEYILKTIPIEKPPSMISFWLLNVDDYTFGRITFYLLENDTILRIRCYFTIGLFHTYASLFCFIHCYW